MFHPCFCKNRRISALITAIITILIGPIMIITILYLKMSREIGNEIFSSSPVEVFKLMSEKIPDLSQILGFYLPPAILFSLLGLVFFFASLKKNLMLSKLAVLFSATVLVFSFIMIFVILLLTPHWLDCLPLSLSIIILVYFTWIFCDFENQLFRKLNGLEKLTSSAINNNNNDISNNNHIQTM